MLILIVIIIIILGFSFLKDKDPMEQYKKILKSDSSDDLKIQQELLEYKLWLILWQDVTWWGFKYEDNLPFNIACNLYINELEKFNISKNDIVTEFKNYIKKLVKEINESYEKWEILEEDYLKTKDNLNEEKISSWNDLLNNFNIRQIYWTLNKITKEKLNQTDLIKFYKNVYDNFWDKLLVNYTYAEEKAFKYYQKNIENNN